MLFADCLGLANSQASAEHKTIFLYITECTIRTTNPATSTGTSTTVAANTNNTVALTSSQHSPVLTLTTASHSFLFRQQRPEDDMPTVKPIPLAASEVHECIGKNLLTLRRIWGKEGARPLSYLCNREHTIKTKSDGHSCKIRVAQWQSDHWQSLAVWLQH